MKTPKRIIPCPMCGAPLEIGTTVIKSWDERYEVPAFFCSRSGEEITLPFKSAKEFSARCIRKNREARLKNIIRHLKQTIAELEHDCRERGEAVEELLEQNKQAYLEIEALKSANREIAVWLKELCEQKEPTLLQKHPIDRLVKLYAHKRHRVPYSTYGQDIEGS